MKNKLFALLSLALLILLTSCATGSDMGTVSANVTNTISIDQDVIADPNNSSTTNINSGANFTGSATSTLGISDIQVSLKTDQDMIVYVEQSPDSTNWDIVDHYDLVHSLGGDSWDTKAVNSYVRVVVVNTSSGNTTYFRLQTALLPIGEPLPRALSDTGRLEVSSSLVDDYMNDIEGTPNSEMKVASAKELVGGIFITPIVDPNYWSVNTTANASVFIDSRTGTTGGELSLSTNTTANGESRVSSVRRARYIPAESNMVRITMHMPDNGTVNNVRRWGVADYTTITSLTDGALFQLSGTTLSVITIRGGTTTTISNGSFNGAYGNSYSVDNSTAHLYEIYYTTHSVLFSIDGKALHRIIAASAPWTNSINLYIYMDNVNSGGSTTDLLMHVRSASISRWDGIIPTTKSVHITSGTTTIAKYSAGTLLSITINNPTNITITIYDNTVASGTVLAVITPLPNSPPVSLTYGVDFSTGLTIVTTGSIDMTVMYN